MLVGPLVKLFAAQSASRIGRRGFPTASRITTSLYLPLPSITSFPTTQTQCMMSSTNNEIPKEMKRLVVASPGDGTSIKGITVKIETLPTPTPKENEVLVKVAAAPTNPSDYGWWYKSEPSAYPMVMGKEGCGIVAATGGGPTTKHLPVGTPVGFFCEPMMDASQGSYSDYVTRDAAMEIFPMPKDVPIEDCASFMINPYTAIGIMDTAQKEGTNAIVHTAGAGQLGQMLTKLSPIKGIEVINLVRRPEQKKLLESMGSKHIIITKEKDWKEQLKNKISELNATCAFDCVSGDMIGHVMDVMPKGGIVYSYGALAGTMSGINPADLIYGKKQLKSFYLTDWMMKGGVEEMVPRLTEAGPIVNSGLKAPDGWSSTLFQDTTMDKVHEDIVKLSESPVTEKKLRVRFD